jgi:hypothetical protein
MSPREGFTPSPLSYDRPTLGVTTGAKSMLDATKAHFRFFVARLIRELLNVPIIGVKNKQPTARRSLPRGGASAVLQRFGYR